MKYAALCLLLLPLAGCKPAEASENWRAKIAVSIPASVQHEVTPSPPEPSPAVPSPPPRAPAAVSKPKATACPCSGGKCRCSNLCTCAHCKTKSKSTAKTYPGYHIETVKECDPDLGTCKWVRKWVKDGAAATTCQSCQQRYTGRRFVRRRGR